MNTATNWKALEEKIPVVVKPGRRPAAVSFRESPPADVQKFEGTQPSGCSFWRLAAEGRTFYTLPEHHFNCAVGGIRAQHYAFTGATEGDRADAQDDVRTGLCEA